VKLRPVGIHYVCNAQCRYRTSHPPIVPSYNIVVVVITRTPQELDCWRRGAPKLVVDKDGSWNVAWERCILALPHKVEQATTASRSTCARS
jgi:hypothetical protein